MARMGMDVDAVELIARSIQGDADHLGQLTANVEALVRKLPGLWDGADATRFVHEWWPQHRKTLGAVQESVRGLGQSALNNASEQRQASAAPGAGGADSHASGSGRTPSSPAPAPAAPSGGNPPSAGGADRYTEATKTQPWLARQPGNWYQCATWASFRRQELGLSNPGGNGDAMAGNVGLVDPSSAGVGSLISTGDGLHRDGTYDGHVMVVEQKLSDSPLEFRVSEMNVGNNGSDVATPQEYRDNTIVEQRADGTWAITRDSVGDGKHFYTTSRTDLRFSSNAR